MSGTKCHALVICMNVVVARGAWVTHSVQVLGVKVGWQGCYTPKPDQFGGEEEREKDRGRKEEKEKKREKEKEEKEKKRYKEKKERKEAGAGGTSVSEG